jgi:Leucine-rich repeat (LRR) protein
MADVMAIVSKAVFEKMAGKAPVAGTQLHMASYTSANKNLEVLASGGRLFLVTVRPPNEALWLVAILEQPKFDGNAWVAAPSPIPITDISALRDKLKFESGKGITSDPGALGMSLQTPRQLTALDVSLLVGGPPPPPPPDAKRETDDRPRKAALIQAMLDDPESDLPRQVFADERLLHNDPRGHLILLDLALAKPLSIRKRAQLTERRDALLEEHGKTWFPYKIGAARRRGGFLEGVTATLNQLADPELFANEPIVDVIATGVEGGKKLVKAAWLSRVRRLAVRGALGDDGFAALVTAPAAQGLQALNVTANGIGKLDALASNLPYCRVLSLTGNSIGDKGLAQLAKWTHLPQVETLYLTKCGITSDGVKALLEIAMPGLQKLCLSSNELEDGIAKVIATRAKNVPNLRRLELKNTQISNEAVDALVKVKLSRLSMIDVRINRKTRHHMDPRVRADL